MRDRPSILHLDLDAFYASVEQRDKPSLRGKPVVVGGLGPRGVVSTASYEARVFGVRSAMSMQEARGRCPNAAFLSTRFDAYREVSTIVMGIVEQVSPVYEPLSLDECFIDLGPGPWTVRRVRAVGAAIKEAVHSATGLRASIGGGTSKLVAKIASDLDKPDGLRIVDPGTERALLDPMPVSKLWGVGPATEARLRRIGVATIADLARVPEDELIGLLGQANGTGLHRMAVATDDRAVTAHRESKSISVEDTFERDVVDRGVLTTELARMATTVTHRLREAGLSARTVTVKVRHPDFSIVSRSATLPGPCDDVRLIDSTARRLLAGIDTSDGIRLLGVGVSGLADWTQNDLFSSEEPELPAEEPVEAPTPATPSYRPGQDVVHAVHGPGWVWGAGLGRVTVRFETRFSVEPGPVRTFSHVDPDLRPA